MPAVRPRKRQKGFPFLILALALLLGAGATVGGLWAMGVEMPFAHWFAKAEPERPEPVMVNIPASARPIAAYRRVTREDLVNRQAMSLHFIKLSPAQSVGKRIIGLSLDGHEVDDMVARCQVREGQVVFFTAAGLEVPRYSTRSLGGALMDANAVMGRVLARDKAAGYGFTETDFLPEGTRPGMVAGIPPGKKALTIEAAKISGIYGLQPGDHFDLLASVPLEKPKSGGGSSRLPGAALVVSAGAVPAAEPAKKADVRVLVSDGVIVSPLTTRQIPTTTASLTQGARATTRPVQEVVIAVASEEAARLTEALATDVAIICVARSGRPDDPGGAMVLPEEPEAPKTQSVHLIVGSKRQVILTNGAAPPSGSLVRFDRRDESATPVTKLESARQ